jgi:hypothetical protein
MHSLFVLESGGPLKRSIHAEPQEQHRNCQLCRSGGVIAAAKARSMWSDAWASAGAWVRRQSGLPAPLTVPRVSIKSLTANVRTESGPVPAPATGANSPTQKQP